MQLIDILNFYVDIDECLNSTLHNCTGDGQQCKNIHGSYHCYCQPGFTKSDIATQFTVAHTAKVIPVCEG